MFMALFAGLMYFDRNSGYEKGQAIFYTIINVSFVPFMSGESCSMKLYRIFLCWYEYGAPNVL